MQMETIMVKQKEDISMLTICFFSKTIRSNCVIILLNIFHLIIFLIEPIIESA